MKALTIACLGKGGTGKTLLSTLIGRIARDQGKRALLVDADPVMGLTVNAGLLGIPTVAQAREQIIERVRTLADASEEEVREVVAYVTSRTLVERHGLGFLAMGQTSSLGCYCSINLLLRKMLGAMVERFEVVVVDAEAGIEQVNRQVVEKVDQLLFVSDGSQRAVLTCLMLRDTVAKVPAMQDCRMGVVFNRVGAVPEHHRRTLEAAGLAVLGCVTADEQVTQADTSEGALHVLSATAPAYVQLRRLLADNGLLK